MALLGSRSFCASGGIQTRQRQGLRMWDQATHNVHALIIAHWLLFGKHWVTKSPRQTLPHCPPKSDAFYSIQSVWIPFISKYERCAGYSEDTVSCRAGICSICQLKDLLERKPTLVHAGRNINVVWHDKFEQGLPGEPVRLLLLLLIRIKKTNTAQVTLHTSPIHPHCCYQLSFQT